MSDYERIRDLPVQVDGYRLIDNDKTFGEWTRGSTLVELSGAGQTGVGEDVVYEVLDHVANRDRGPSLDLGGSSTLGELCDRIGSLDLFGGAPPEREVSRNYRRWAFESAALDLALRQNDLALHAALGRDPQPLRFVCSTRLSSFDSDAASNTDPIRQRLARYPGLEFKLDPETDWTPELIAEIAALATVDVLDLKGYYAGTIVEVETDPELYRAVAAAFPNAYLEDPDITDETLVVLEPHLDRVTFDAPIHSIAEIEALPISPKTINSKPSRWGSLEQIFAVYEYCEQNGIGIYSGGQGEVGPGRGQVQYLSSLYHADMPNDIAPSGYNDPSVPAGMPTSPMDPAASPTGFRWGE